MRSRVTFHNPNGDFGIEGVDLTKLDKPLYAAVAKLERYEDTGLSPDDVDLLKDMYDRLVEELDRHPRKWISVRDKLPEDGEDVLVCTQSKNGSRNIDKGYWSINRFVHRGCANVTHWMPLPEPPED